MLNWLIFGGSANKLCYVKQNTSFFMTKLELNRFIPTAVLLNKHTECYKYTYEFGKIKNGRCNFFQMETTVLRSIIF